MMNDECGMMMLRSTLLFIHHSSFRIHHLTSMLRVTEIFRSIQGESTHAGRPCAFVRLTGCPMRCTWCDSEYTFTGGERVSIEDVMRQVRALGCQLVEGTGGEPLGAEAGFELLSALGG